ncbi:MAG: tetratricopeptide repeat protein [Chthoniobacterales bacterium]
MTRYRADYFLRLLFFPLIFSQALLAQEPEVRRALPVNSSDNSSSQDQHVFSKPASGDETQGVHGEQKPQSIDMREVRRAEQVTAGGEAGKNSTIRIAPVAASDATQVAEAQLAVAEGFFNRKQYDSAVPEYEKFLKITAPGQPRRDQALFHQGESLRFLGKGFKSQSIYQQLLTEYALGEFAASAAYRLGEYYYGRKENKEAAEAFLQAAKRTDNPKLQNAARYQEALCRDELGEQTQATVLLDAVSKNPENDLTRNNALMLLAAREEKSGEKEKALANYQIISRNAVGKLASEALVKAGMVAAGLGKNDQALQFFDQAAGIKDGGDWSSIAALGSMKLFYASKDYEKVLSKSDQASSNLQARSEALLLTANAQRQLGNKEAALLLYDKIVQEFSASDPAREAAFARLVILQEKHDPTFFSQIEEYLLATTDPHARAQAELLRAEALFQENKYAEAAAAYENLKTTDLSATLKADALYKEAWSLDHVGDTKSALGLFSEFITAYPASPQLLNALIQRASLEQKAGDFLGALADYSILLKNYPAAPERELVLQQKALTHGEERDNKGMTETFQQLLKEYPKSAAAAQANFWIGWAAFENKDYAGAIASLERAKELDRKSFGERAGVRLLLSHYYLEQVDAVLREATGLKPIAVPAEVSRWLGLKMYERGDFAQTEHFLNAVVSSQKKELMTIEVQSALADALVKQGKFSGAEVPAKKALELATDPTTRAEAMLILATAQKGLKKYDEAAKSVNEAELLQPEGNINSSARMVQAELFFLQKNYDAATRAYKAVALLTSDPRIKSEALRKAAEAYDCVNNPAN